mgnify:CR=1 FL=1
MLGNNSFFSEFFIQNSKPFFLLDLDREAELCALFLLIG